MKAKIGKRENIKLCAKFLSTEEWMLLDPYINPNKSQGFKYYTSDKRKYTRCRQKTRLGNLGGASTEY